MVPATYPSAPHNQHPHHHKQYPPDAMSTGPNRESYSEHNTPSTLVPQQEYEPGTFPPYPHTYHEPYTTQLSPHANHPSTYDDAANFAISDPT